jgi:hypothetical protein
VHRRDQPLGLGDHRAGVGIAAGVVEPGQRGVEVVEPALGLVEAGEVLKDVLIYDI